MPNGLILFNYSLSFIYHSFSLFVLPPLISLFGSNNRVRPLRVCKLWIEVQMCALA